MTDNKPIHLSICIPLYNKAPYLARALNGIARQKFQNYEVVVVDNASEDNPQPVLDEWKDKLPLRVFRLPITLSIHENWAFALGLARAELVQLHLADDYLAENGLVPLIAALDADPKLDYVLGRTVPVDEDEREITEGPVAKYHRDLDGHRSHVQQDLTIQEKARFLRTMGLGQNFFGDINPLLMRRRCVEFLRAPVRTTAPLFHTVPDLEIYLRLFCRFNGRFLDHVVIRSSVNRTSTYVITRNNRDLSYISYEIPGLQALPFLWLHPEFREVNRNMPFWTFLGWLWDFCKRLLRPLVKSRFKSTAGGSVSNGDTPNKSAHGANVNPQKNTAPGKADA
jgi:glycosyltransferase involved in cell wall biosynthesis